ncbi:hypothetical protein Q5Y75_24650 [Ruegeria sp. 2205SS24-7]|uniref:hypothetical protein n=1 Tax=Ruegeria discodermiae TaxID=3064389 RepID=UPI002741A6F9|nr:hypothetical protein [Ruegeria sp. 2205SS24-7]MDP5220382.1 hypothetical protein [Ruegeria sp. 2205SS24-7]
MSQVIRINGTLVVVDKPELDTPSPMPGSLGKGDGVPTENVTAERVSMCDGKVVSDIVSVFMEGCTSDDGAVGKGQGQIVPPRRKMQIGGRPVVLETDTGICNGILIDPKGKAIPCSCELRFKKQSATSKDHDTLETSVQVDRGIVPVSQKPGAIGRQVKNDVHGQVLSEMATPAQTRSTNTIPGRGWMFVLVHQLPEVGNRNIIRRVVVVPQDFIPKNPGNRIRPAEHYFSSKNSQFLSASDRSHGSPTEWDRLTGYSAEGKQSAGYLIDTKKVERAGGRVVRPSELIQDLKKLARENPAMRQTVDLAIDTIERFEGETLIEGSLPKGSTREMSPQHSKYLHSADEIFEAVTKEQITRTQAAHLLRKLDKSFRNARDLGRLGRGVAVFGFVMTAYDIGFAAKESVDQVSLRPITAEGVRQVGGWAAASAGATLGFKTGALVGIETGPGAIVTGAIGAILFGWAGYTGADWLADLIYEN